MRVLVPLTLPEANQVVEALSNRVASMQHRVTIGKARVADVHDAIIACHSAEMQVRATFGFEPETFDPAEGSYDPPRLTPDPGDWFAGMGA